jgi:sugar phosphate isomerase/epimerase
MEETKFQIAVAATALTEQNIRTAPQIARRMGFPGVQFDAVSSSLDLTTLSQSGRREFAHLLSSADQRLVGLRAGTGARGLGIDADIDKVLWRMTAIMEAAKGFNAPLVCVDIGSLPEPQASEPPKPRITAEQAGPIIIPQLVKTPAPIHEPPRTGPDPSRVSQVNSALAELGARADRMGVTIAFRSELASCAAIDRALQAAGCPWFGIDLDPVAMLRDRWSSDEIFSRFGPLIRHVRARDARVGTDRRTQPAIIGQGAVPWAELLCNLDSTGYRGWITIDPIELPDRIATAQRGLEYLQSSAQLRRQ